MTESTLNSKATNKNAKGGYFSVSGLNMYYEVHGTGRPLVLLHGGMTTIGDFELLMPSLAETREVIAVEQQAHGHTADIDRPLSLEHMADDTAALIKHLRIEKADIFGYSFGGTVALAFAIRHPNLVRKLVLASAIYAPDGYYPEIVDGLRHATAEAMPPIIRETYVKVAPYPEDWPKLVAKATKAAAEFKGWRPEAIQAIMAPTLVMVGDADIVRPEHAVELFRLLGGGVFGDTPAGLPNSQLAILPGTSHVSLVYRADLLLPIITSFLDAPMPEGK